MSRRIRQARGITLIELLVGILVTGVALTLVLPYISKLRGQAQVHGGVNNMRKIGQGVRNYHDIFQSFPSQPKPKDN